MVKRYCSHIEDYCPVKRQVKTIATLITAAQVDWLNRLDVIERKSSGLVVARLWKPSDWLSGEIEEVLRNGA